MADKPKKKPNLEGGTYKPKVITLGDVFGEAIAKDREEARRRAELDDMGFRAIQVDP